MSGDVSAVRRRMIERSRRPLSSIEPLIPPRYAPGAGGPPGDAAGLTPDPGPLTAVLAGLADAPAHDGADGAGTRAAREAVSRETAATGAAKPATAAARAAVTAAAAPARHDAEATRAANLTPGAATAGDGTEAAREARAPGQGARRADGPLVAGADQPTRSHVVSVRATRTTRDHDASHPEPAPPGWGVIPPAPLRADGQAGADVLAGADLADLAGWPGRAGRSGGPDVVITIGHIEVRAAPPAGPQGPQVRQPGWQQVPRRPRPGFTPRVPLADFLSERGESRR
jgi:hypothetical protein